MRHQQGEGKVKQKERLMQLLLIPVMRRNGRISGRERHCQRGEMVCGSKEKSGADIDLIFGCSPP